MKSLKYSLMVAMAMGLSACGSSGAGGGAQGKCQAVCERAQAKGCSTQVGSFFNHDNCIAGCAATTAMNADTNSCAALSVAYDDCATAAGDVCLVFEYADNTTGGPAQTMACPAQTMAFANCILGFCGANPAKAYCK